MGCCSSSAVLHDGSDLPIADVVDLEEVPVTVDKSHKVSDSPLPLDDGSGNKSNKIKPNEQQKQRRKKKIVVQHQTQNFQKTQRRGKKGNPSLRDNGHRSSAGHRLIHNFLVKCGLELIDHEQKIFSSNGNLFAEPDLVFKFYPHKNHHGVTVYVEIKFDTSTSHSTLVSQCKKLHQLQGDRCVFGFLCSNASFWYFLSFGSHHQVLKKKLRENAMKIHPNARKIVFE